MPTPDPYRILSLGGGGFIGLFAALMLEEFESRVSDPVHAPFDLLVGTSVGGIAALALSAGIPVRKVADIFIEHGQEIFRRPQGVPGLRNVTGVMRHLRAPKYDGNVLTRIMAETFGEMRLSDLRKDVLVTALRLHDGEPVLFTRHTHPHALVAEVALATSAAPILFPSRAVGGVLHADGAIFANCPDELAMNAAIENGGSFQTLTMISLGAPRRPAVYGTAREGRLGIIDWLSGNRLVNAAVSAQERLAIQRVRHFLGDRYFKIEAQASPDQARHLGIDVAGPEPVVVLQDIARDTAETLDWDRVRTMLGMAQPLKRATPSIREDDRFLRAG